MSYLTGINNNTPFLFLTCLENLLALILIILDLGLFYRHPPHPFGLSPIQFLLTQGSSLLLPLQATYFLEWALGKLHLEGIFNPLPIK